MGKSILVAGASGSVGGRVLRKALADRRAERVVALVRRGTGLADAKLDEWVAGEKDLLEGLKDQRVDAVICCLGTTIRNVGGDKAKFIHVDQELVLGLAAWAERMGVPVFSVVSAMGADARSKVFYNRVKGAMEAGLRGSAIPRTVIFQPSILTGPRKEWRLGERIGIAVMRAFAPLMVGGLSGYRPMPSDVLATALLEAVFSDESGPGIHVLRYNAIHALANARRPVKA